MKQEIRDILSKIYDLTVERYALDLKIISEIQALLGEAVEKLDKLEEK